MIPAKEKKLEKWEPTAIKEDLLKKYPPKVARKRAKQILINEALENDTPEITANVRTIPGIITMRGCTYAGCKGVIMGPTRDIVNIGARPHRLRLLLLAHPAQPDRCLRSECGKLHDLLFQHGHAGQGHHLRRGKET